MNETTSTTGVRELIEPVYRGKFWMQLIGVMLILSGVLTALSIIGIIVAWIPIWAGVVLMQAAGSFARAYERDDELEAKNAMGRLRTHFTIMGVLLLVYILLMVLGFLFGIGAGMMGMSELQGM
ncbi:MULTISPECIES: DUF5362 family protein [unclassified Thioalkalivibrio]|uniref:DUF5362 family protein n=1 Tax=unclassified Thioalkalivibrio TaxID=2621013 RepID=UPI000363BFE5|nr:MULTISPECIES: DUF5362 family protein [unclassified Thioalkalivibrio]